MTSNDFFCWVRDNIDPKVGLEKHRTQAGDFLGWKYFINLPNTNRPKPIEVIFFDDGLCYMGFSAWIKPEIICKMLLVLKNELEAAK